MTIHFIQQEAWLAPGAYAQWAEARGWAASYTRCWAGEPLPQKAEADLLVVLGGMMCPATPKAICPTFDAEAERALIRQYAQAGRAVVGICLGAQLLGEALGAPYAHSPEREIGPVSARLTPAGRADPLLAAFPDTFPAGAWHSDMPGLTPESAVLAESDGCPRQIVRYGPLLYGFQAHMEFTPALVAAGIRHTNIALRIPGRYIQSTEALLEYDYTAMNALLFSFLDALAARYRASQQK